MARSSAARRRPGGSMRLAGAIGLRSRQVYRPRTSGPPAGESSRPDRTAQLVKAITAVASVLALLTALLYYFGWVRSEYQARAFGADASVFGMSSQELVIRSADVLFPPLLGLLLASVLALWAHGRLLLMTDDRARRGRVVGLVRVLRLSWLLALVATVVIYLMSPSVGQLAVPFLFAFGVGGTWYGHTLGARLAKGSVPLPTPLFLALSAVMALSMFWMTERAARVGGEARIEGIKADVGSTLEAATIYSPVRLQLAGSDLTETKLNDPEAGYRYRYNGAFLLQRSGGSYFMITDGWRDGRGRLISIPESTGVRLEFGPG